MAIDCILKNLRAQNRAIVSESTGEDELKQSLSNYAAALTTIGGDITKDFHLGDSESIDTIDMLVRKLTMYDDDNNIGFASYESFRNKATADQVSALEAVLKESIYKLVESEVSTSNIDSMDEIFNASIARQAFLTAVRHVKVDKTTAVHIPILKMINKAVELSGNNLVAMQHLPWGKRAHERIAYMKNYAESGKTSISNKIRKLLSDAEKVPVFIENKLSRADLSRMLPVLDGVDYDNPKQMQAATSKLMDLYDYDYDQASRVVHGLVGVAKGWNIINYGMAKPTTAEIAALKEKPIGGTLVAYLRGMRSILADYYQEAVTTTKLDKNSPAAQAIEYYIRGTDINLRYNYMPSLEDMQLDLNLKDIENFFGEERYGAIPGFYNKRIKDSGDSENDFEPLAIGNVIAAYMLFNRGMQILSRSVLKAEYDHAVVSGEYAENHLKRDAIDSTGHYIKKLDKVINYNPGNVPDSVRNTRNALSIFSLYVSSIISAPKSAINNLFGGSLSRFARGLAEGSYSEYHDALGNDKYPDMGLRKVAQAANEATLYYKSPGMASEFTALPENTMERFAVGVRKVADWLGDGGFMRHVPIWKENLTVKGTEDRMREYVSVMVFNRTAERMRLLNIDASDPQYSVKAKEIAESVAVDAWTELSSALGHFDPTNKPLWAHLRYETAETLPTLLLGFAAKSWHTFRHVTTSVIDNLVRSTTDVLGESVNPYTNSSGGNAVFGKTVGRSQAKAATATLITIALVSLFRELIKEQSKEDEDSAIGKLASVVGNTRVGLIEASNPIQGLDDIVKSMAQFMGIMNMSDEDYAKAKSRAWAYGVGILGGREIASLMEDDKPQLNNLVNFLSFNGDFTRVFSREIVDAGINGQGLYERRRAFREATTMFRTSYPVDLAASVLGELGMIGLRNNDPDEAAKYRSVVARSVLNKMFGLSQWADVINDEYDGRKNYDRYFLNSPYTTAMNRIKLDRVASVEKYIDNINNPEKTTSKYIKKAYGPAIYHRREYARYVRGLQPYDKTEY